MFVFCKVQDVHQAQHYRKSGYLKGCAHSWLNQWVFQRIKPEKLGLGTLCSFHLSLIYKIFLVLEVWG